ncbi:hypothetical protein [Spirosoma flavum]|uniref:Uncharacterized protein n=1 Tax=Spirosoma flavum TaxID=2048557 RepID=A0ABW6AMU9_9BACT
MMNYKATTTLKKADTDGRVPEHTLDQYVRSELSQQLINALKSTLSINRSDRISESDHLMNQTTVDFTTELVILKPLQWQQLKDSLSGSIQSLAIDRQMAIRQLIADVDTTH